MALVAVPPQILCARQVVIPDRRKRQITTWHTICKVFHEYASGNSKVVMAEGTGSVVMLRAFHF